MDEMSWLQVVVLAVVQGLTEFLPVSSSAHLAIVSEAFFGADAGASFTAVVQIGTEVAVLLYFAKDIGRILAAWFGGLTDATRRTPDYWLGWWVILGTVPIGIFGFTLQHLIRGDIRNLWIIGTALIVFSFVIAAAEYLGKQTREIQQFTWRDSLIIGSAQALALIPGVSRSGVTISAGLFLGQKREAAARFGFLLAIPAVLGSGLYELRHVFEPGDAGMSATVPQIVLGTLIAFVVGYAAVAWFLRFLVRHSMYWFVGYRIALGTLVLVLLGTGVLAAQ